MKRRIRVVTQKDVGKEGVFSPDCGGWETGRS